MFHCVVICMNRHCGDEEGQCAIKKGSPFGLPFDVCIV